MKNKKFVLGISGVAIFVAGILTMASCSLFSLQGITAIENIPGSLTVVVSDASVSVNETSSFRTIVPSFSSSVKSYLITCTQDGGTLATETLTSQSYTFSNLPPGTVTVNVTAYNDEATQTASTLIASGSSEVTLTSGSAANVLVNLDYAQSTGATGSLNYTIKWPEGSADSFNWKIDDGIYTEVTPGSATDEFFTSTITQSSVSAGTHSLLIQFYKDGAIAGYAYESVNVYDNLESNFVVGTDGSLSTTRVFTSAEIASTGTDVSLIIIAGDDAEYISLDSDTLSGSYNPSTDDPLCVIPLVGESGQMITYTWQSGTDAVTDPVAITADSPISLTLATSTGTESASNILTLNVIAANTSTAKSYTIIMLSPILVSDETALADAFTDLANNIVLTDDITLTSDWIPVCSNETRFTGTFDGGGFSITGLTINISTGTAGDAGLFSATSSTACISNVRLVNVSISDSSTGDGIGALVGENFGTITNCSVSGTVTGVKYVGGLVGNNRDTGIISECYSTASVSASTKYAGGLVGGNWSIIENCYARSAVSLVSSGTETIGGLLGKSYGGTIANCYSSSTVFNSTGGGGLIGINDETCTSSYYNSELCGLSDTTKGTPLTTDEIRTQTNFTDWDFTDIWAIDSDVNTAYPYLKAIPPEAITIDTGNASTATDLYNLISSDLSADYTLAEDLDITGTDLISIGSSEGPFSGTFNGSGHTITGLSISTDTADSGMFASVGVGGTVKNLYLTNVSISGDATSYKGGLAAYNYGTIYRCTSSGSVGGDGYVGGLIGANYGTMSECWSNAAISATFSSGGLVGSNGSATTAGIIENCYARGSVTTISGGGLVGSNVSGTISHSYAAGQVSTDDVDGDRQAFVGEKEAAASIDNCYYDESKIGNSYADGGIIDTGFNGTPQTGIEMRTQGTFDSAWDFTASTGMWEIERGKNGGYPYLQNVEPTSDTEIASAAELSGITNLDGDYILTADCALEGEFTPISSSGSQFTGSFDGNDKIITGLKMNSTSEWRGLFGYVKKAGFIRNVILKDVSIQAYNFAGALVGYNKGTVYRCASSGSVSGNSSLGGLISRNFGLISECYSVVALVATTSHVGGLIADNYTTGRVINSYARGYVTGTDYLGGLMGSTDDNENINISNCYSTGAVSGTGDVTRIDGMIGFPETLVTAPAINCYFDSATSGDSAAGTGKGTATSTGDMKTSTTFNDWDIATSSSSDTIWGIGDIDGTTINDGYPYLQWAGANTLSLVQIPSGAMTASELNSIIAADLSANYTLTGDISLTAGDDWTPIGSAETSFTGTFDGGDNTISGVSIEDPTEGWPSDYQGFFGYVETPGIVQNVILTDVSILVTSKYTGALVGYNTGNLYRCATSGSVTSDRLTGGLAGYNTGTIEECYSIATVEAEYQLGGLVGFNQSGIILNSYARGAVTAIRTSGSNMTGGFLGVTYNDDSAISNSYSTGVVTCDLGANSYGGFLGSNYNNKITIESCFYDELSGQSDTGNGLLTSTTDMQTMATFSTDWNITDESSAGYVWGIGSIDGTTINEGYPYLQWAGAATLVP